MKYKVLKENNKKGFTLIEMVMIVAILGILSSMGLVKYGQVQKTAKENADYVTAANIATAASIALSDKVASNDITVSSLVSKGYLASEPKPQSIDNKDFKIDATNNNITVSVGDIKFYPKP
ncbi:MAG: prepilin-type N-terminal cleavage/methylation domain-containing protein [Romboutsia sp.]